MNRKNYNFIRLMKNVQETFGVMVAYDEKENAIPSISEIDDAYFVCPECGEPILYADYADEIDYDDPHCPICEAELY